MKKQPVVIDDAVVELDGIKLTEEEIAGIEAAVGSVKYRKNQKSVLSKSVRRTPKISANSKKSMAFNGVDSWTQKIEKKKLDVGFEEYCVHKFKIGSNQYQMVERNIAGKGIVVNPDYKIREDMPFMGGVARRSGDLVFWDYYFPETGWERVRELTKNEVICFEIIMEQGRFAEVAKAEAVRKEQTTET